MSDSKNEKIEGLTIRKSRVTSAFLLISFLVTEQVFIDKTIQSPLRVEKNDGLDEDSIMKLKGRVFRALEEGESVYLAFSDSLVLYLLIDIACKLFVSDTNMVLKDMAQTNLDIDADEYQKVRESYLHHGQALLTEMNEKYAEQPEFKKTLKNLRNWLRA